MTKLRISAVSYTNTKPFVYGIQHSGILRQIDLSLDIPTDCAQKLIDDKADIGLIPAAALLQLPVYYIISDYCIGSAGAVNSVFLFSTRPVGQIKTVRLDSQSRTSNNLAKVLLKNYWNQEVDFITDGTADAFVQIGDRTFGEKQKHAYAYDLGQCWMDFTGLPFVYAVWAANKPIQQDFIDKFNAALKLGLDHRKEVIANLAQYPDFDLDDYLYNKLDFTLDKPKREALTRYLELVQAL